MNHQDLAGLSTSVESDGDARVRPPWQHELVRTSALQRGRLADPAIVHYTEFEPAARRLRLHHGGPFERRRRGLAQSSWHRKSRVRVRFR
ncbi:hypothetical protein QJS66_16140 [Kocuria rhizophila]|nr:hypothetical protein QJS66_16140 [Kocuria rhizophila]